MPRVPATLRVRDDGALVVDLVPPRPTYQAITADTSGVVGQPCVWFDGREASWEYGWRVESAPWMDGTRLAVRLCKEADWWQAVLSGSPHPLEVTVMWADHVWLVTYGDRAPA